MGMSMSKRFQIPASPKDRILFQSAARRAGLSAAEWARRLLRREAEREIQGKSWDRFFSELHAIADPGNWEAPERKPPRLVKKSDDWS
jgi:hypothetical protein